ncbi:MAG: hypothetical protein N2037_06380 [Acidimicrobiales bacterium]|nr:hypothetical protein [Acidimicrobiales bacterium]
MQGSSEWRSSMEEPERLPVAPRGRKGLWDAMARAADPFAVASTALAIDPSPVAPDMECEAHLTYLARLANGEPDDGIAEVIDLVAYRANRR